MGADSGALHSSQAPATGNANNVESASRRGINETTLVLAVRRDVSDAMTCVQTDRKSKKCGVLWSMDVHRDDWHGEGRSRWSIS
jgi:hypothetical protein